MQAHIQKLDESTIVQIAAGEVIERPSCIIKELIENALDAGSTHIEIAIKSGGMDEITVSDNGAGILADELYLAVTPHATSKLSKLEDLDHIPSFGFRGEALASIASVSELNIYSKTPEADSGQHLKCRFGEIEFQKPVAIAQGTRMQITSLFLNVPARKKFLRSASTEKSHIEKTILRAAMVLPHISWIFMADGETVYNLEKCKNVQARVAQIYGKDTASHLLEVHQDGGEFSVSGLISNKDLTYARSQEIWFYVNGRAIQDRILHSAVMEGYRTALMERRYPFALIDLQTPKPFVDVNIHPRKSEVRFQNSSIIYQLVSKAVASTLDPKTSSSFDVQPWNSKPSASTYTTPAAQLNFLARAMEPSSEYTPSTQTTYFEGLSYAGHVDHTYLIFLSGHKLIVIDQHAAHERVLFEKMKHSLSDTHAQNLLIPSILELNAANENHLKRLTPFLTELGFNIDPFGPRTYSVRTVPAWLRQKDPKSFLIDLLQDESFSRNNVALSNMSDDIFSRLACHAAIRAHDVLTSDEVKQLLKDMDQTRLSSYCPHGRPTFFEFGVDQLEKLFHRV